LGGAIDTVTLGDATNTANFLMLLLAFLWLLNFWHWLQLLGQNLILASQSPV